MWLTQPQWPGDQRQTVLDTLMTSYTRCAGEEEEPPCPRRAFPWWLRRTRASVPPGWLPFHAAPHGGFKPAWAWDADPSCPPATGSVETSHPAHWWAHQSSSLEIAALPPWNSFKGLWKLPSLLCKGSTLPPHDKHASGHSCGGRRSEHWAENP